jgi:hypothetical protein
VKRLVKDDSHSNYRERLKVKILRIKVRDVPRETLKELLSRSRQGRGEPSMLTPKPVEGYHLAAIDDDEVAQLVQDNLDAMRANYEEVELPEGMTFAAMKLDSKAFASGSSSAGLHEDGTRMWTGDYEVDKAISVWLVDMYKPRRGLFDL